MSDPETLAVYAAQSAEYAVFSNTFLAQDPLLANFIAKLPCAGRALDLGCGPGAAATVMAKAGLYVHATDAVAQMIAQVPSHPHIHAEIRTFDQIEGRNVYDGIWANYSLLHAPRESLPGLLQALHGTLKPQGVFHIAMKLGTQTARDKIGRQYTYVTEDELRGLLREAGYTVTEKSTGRDKGLDGTYADWIALAGHG